MWMLFAVLLLGSVVSGHKIAAERTYSDSGCTRLTDEFGIMILNCSWQDLITVPAISPGQLVHTLDLSHNSLHKLHNSSFHLYPNLTQLILSFDNITRIEVETFSSLKALRKVDLSYNSLIFIHPNIFPQNKNLEMLSLQGNPLHTLHTLRTPFLIAMSLQSLDLSHCHLSHFSTDSLSGLPELKNLDLRHNSLQQLSLNNAPEFSSLQLAGNHWQCDCHFHALLMWISANQMMDSDIRTDKTVQCWQGDELRDLINKQDQDSICIREVTGLPIREKITPDLAVIVSDKDDSKLDKNSYLPSSAINEDDVWMYVDDNGEILYTDDEYSEELNENSYFLYAGGVPGLSHQEYAGLSLNVTTKVGDEISGNHKVANYTIQFSKVHDFIPEDTDVSFYDEFNSDSEELGHDSISLLSAEIPSLDDKDDMDLNLSVNMNVGDNNNVVNRTDETGDPVKFSSINDDFIQEDTEAGFYEYELYGEYQDYEESDKDIDPPSSAENPGLKHKDDNIFADVHYSMESSDLHDPNITNKIRDSNIDISSQNNDFIMDDNAAHNNSQIMSNLSLADNNKDDTLNNSRSYDYTCIFCDDHAVPAAEIPSLKYDDYEFSDTFIILENVKPEETAGKDEAADSAIQLLNFHDDLSPEVIADQFVFNLDDTISQEVDNNEILSAAANFQDLTDEDNFDIYNLIASSFKDFYSKTDAQVHKTLMNRINDKSQNETNLKIHTFLRFMIVAGIVAIFVFALVMIFYCITSIRTTPAFPKHVLVCKKVERSESKEHLLQNV